jgi:hypothetical protein
MLKLNEFRHNQHSSEVKILGNFFSTWNPGYTNGKVWINAHQYFGGVPEAVWNFKIGGYQVCNK